MSLEGWCFDTDLIGRVGEWLGCFLLIVPDIGKIIGSSRRGSQKGMKWVWLARGLLDGRTLLQLGVFGLLDFRGFLGFLEKVFEGSGRGEEGRFEGFMMRLDITFGIDLSVVIVGRDWEFALIICVLLSRKRFVFLKIINR